MRRLATGDAASSDGTAAAVSNAPSAPAPAAPIDAFLREDRAKDLLRLVVVGSVDDGKSTLIGRLLHDTDNVALDHLAAVRRATAPEVGDIDFSLFTDGLVAEREQGITIDVAYRYFATATRKFIVADTPGHVQYTRNMVTGASTASLAVILIDARLGVLTQTRRHAYLASLLGVAHLLVAVNKMDLVGFDAARFAAITEDLARLTDGLAFESVTLVPVSALRGDNIVTRSEATPWFSGPTILNVLETASVERPAALVDPGASQPTLLRFPVQWVNRPNLDYRAFAGRIEAGAAKAGDEVVVLPSLQRTRIKAVDAAAEPIASAQAGMSMALRLEDEVDVSRGDMLVSPHALPKVTRTFAADIVWMDERPLDLEKTYWLKHTTQWVRVQVRRVLSRFNPDTLSWEDAAGLELNDIGRVEVLCRRALYLDDYRRCRGTGAFILVDSLTNHTVGGGMVRLDAKGQDLDEALREIRGGSALDAKTQVSPAERRERLGQKGMVVLLTGLPGSGRWALAYALERRLFDAGHTAHVLTPEPEAAGMQAAAKACAAAGLVTVCTFPLKLEAQRAALRAAVGAARVLEVSVETDEALCRERRPNADFDGFEPPASPDLRVALDSARVEDAVRLVIDALATRGVFDHV